MTLRTEPAPISSFTGDYRFASNFSGHPFWLPLLNCEVASGEHGYQALKPLDPNECAWVLAAPDPREAKHRGRLVRARPDWEQMKRPLMMEVELAKFSHPDLGKLLLATREATLIEGNSWGDDFWGAVPDTQTIRGQLWLAADGTYLSGRNWLGRILMTVRELMAPESSR